MSRTRFNVHWLGTSSGLPTPTRNVSCLAVEIGTRLLILDAGEGAQLALRKRGFHLGAIEAVCITHAHGDHCFGLPGLLSTLWLLHQRSPRLIADARVAGIVASVMSLSTGEEEPLDVVTLSQEDPARLVLSFEKDPGLGVRIFAGQLEHRIESHGFRIEVDRTLPARVNSRALMEVGLPPGPSWGRLLHGQEVTLPGGRVLPPKEFIIPGSTTTTTFVYLTDTTFTERSVELARGADLISHEATFLPGDQQRAAQMGHSTTRDALRVLELSGASRMVMTHFSPRYRIEDYQQELDAHPLGGRVTLAEDGLCIAL